MRGEFVGAVVGVEINERYLEIHQSQLITIVLFLCQNLFSNTVLNHPISPTKLLNLIRFTSSGRPVTSG